MASSAPRFARVRAARSSDSAGGGSNNPTPSADIPEALSQSTIWLRSRREISDAVNLSKDASSDWRHSLTTVPGAVRPALPARWAALARLTRSTSSVFTPLAES